LNRRASGLGQDELELRVGNEILKWTSSSESAAARHTTLTARATVTVTVLANGKLSATLSPLPRPDLNVDITLLWTTGRLGSVNSKATGSRATLATRDHGVEDNQSFIH
jgi:hypothetical protein